MPAARRCVVAIWIAVLTVLPSLVRAQTGAATNTGLVADETGGALPGVAITARNRATDVPYVTVSNAAGNYTIASLPVGTYIVSAELQGFRTVTTNTVTLEANQVARLDLKMPVGQLQETVQVDAVSAILQTETTTVGEVLSGTTVQTLPLNGRNTAQLTLLLPGTMTYNPRGFTNIGAINSNRPFVNGNREQTNNFTVDGFDVNETIDNRVSYQPSPDALAEISVETNNYTADTGNVGGAVVASVLKSGTNAFRGNAFEFYRNSDFDANTWENNRSGAAKQERKQHIAGATLGGPILPQRLFFFGDYQGSRHDAPGFGTASVAPAAWRSGDLSTVATVIRDPRTGLPFPGNQIPAARISPVASALLNDLANYPLPNRTVPGGITGNFVGETALAIRAHQGDAKFDWAPSNDNRFVARYSFATYNDRREKNPFPLVFSTFNDQPFWNIGGIWNRVFGPSAVNELLFGYSHTHVLSQTDDWAGVGNADATYGIAGASRSPG